MVGGGGEVTSTLEIHSCHIYTALDPAGPFFEKPETEARLDKTDAQLVDTIHTDGFELGLGYDVSHIDFYPNNGTDPQPGCESGR